MSAQEQIGKLQGLLERIKRNSGKPRVSGAGVAPVAAAPAVAAPPAPAPVSPPPPRVEEIRAAAPEPSPPPLEVEVSLESVPPDAEAAPIPLVSPAASPPAAEAGFALESEVSEVRVASQREPAVEVTVAAIAAEAEGEVEPISEELSEEDLVEVTSIPPAADVDIDFEDEDEQPPASSQRSRVASSMDEALAAAAEQLEAEREVPIKTPPPESGPQAAPMPPGIAAPAAPDVDALLGEELDIPTRAAEAAAGPTAEQLGQTIDLEEARGPALELAEQKASELPTGPAPVEELEMPLPGRDVVGSYDDSLQPPPEAREELEAHRRKLEEDEIPPPPESLATLPSARPVAPAIIPVEASGPEVVARPIPSGSPETFGSVRQSFRPSSFVDLLDASLALRGD